MNYLFEETESVDGWVFHAQGDEHILPGVLYASVKATRERDRLQFGHWAIVVRQEDIPTACKAIRRILDLQIAQREEDE